MSDRGSPAIHGRSREIVIRCRHKTAWGLVMWARSRHDLDFKMLVYRWRSCSRLCILEAPPREIGANIDRTVLGGSGHLILVRGDILQVRGHCMNWDQGEFGRRRPCPGREKMLDQCSQFLLSLLENCLVIAPSLVFVPHEPGQRVRTASE